MANLGSVSTFNINGNEFTFKDPTLTDIVEQIITAIGANNSNIAERINDLHNRSFDNTIKISSNNDAEISNINDGLYKIQYITIEIIDDKETETLNNSAILIQDGTNQYLYKDGQLSSRTKTNNTWNSWVISSGSNVAVNSVNGQTGDVIIDIPDDYEIDYSKKYLTIVSLQDNNTISFKSTTNDIIKTISISINNGQTWIEKSTSTSGVELATLNTNDKLLIKGNNNTYGTSGTYNYFISTANFNVEGNIMSLIYGDNFENQISLTATYTFNNLFYDCNKLISAGNLILPATTLTDGCYYYMFYKCTSLTTAPELHATTLAVYCYSGMFSDCISLTTAPELSITTLANSCYNGMFSGCTSLTTAPELPATTLTNGCYSSMFQGCTTLTTAPELPATTLADRCYTQMFKNCTLINYIKCLATNISASYCTYDWLANTAATGIFIKENNMSSWTTGSAGIPSGWTTYTEYEYEVTHRYELNNINVGVTSVNGSTGAVTIEPLPTVTSTDNGKILIVSNGEWTLISPSTLYSGSGAPNNAQGNNGDLYLQTS